MLPLVYFSSQSENTYRFIMCLNLPANRIPLDIQKHLKIKKPYILLVPSYGGGGIKGAVPKQVIQFLNDESNRSGIRGVIAAGNRNFGKGYCLAGDIIAKKCQVPYLYRFELMGTPTDIANVKAGVTQFW
ncbi:class Ib ribonucleoside-diphosphate reductase assembly flavoprotein NrdI [Candidatus Pantoea edessiphila]|uniref:Protein NrdI n=1 Tax=Candidatus Pantoea edessiphila TaxID=2044610 RepID=A0A2P5SYB8_9GAMM|nr:class Ib ribonucleoside-diphosphate reductase assembly flavoprotein NrdI [Candidatus Pantoea edessiphila]MBK4775538.1 class Ib ribonucleoside-diphosphate reductase assembly flavoprotein NrdI [Pantoea sp. Edef]PPI87337.1 class Ib ribonucleoside-diphosphate reductase assembly flavoprotein NrdI [Candidatus Pantoea edessiphila]